VPTTVTHIAVDVVAARPKCESERLDRHSGSCLVECRLLVSLALSRGGCDLERRVRLRELAIYGRRVLHRPRVLLFEAPALVQLRHLPLFIGLALQALGHIGTVHILVVVGPKRSPPVASRRARSNPRVVRTGMLSLEGVR
jgi:hypothetical protein